MYVAVTRAKDRVYLLHAFRRTIWGRAEVFEPSRFLRDLRGMSSAERGTGGRGELEMGRQDSGERRSFGRAQSPAGGGRFGGSSTASRGGSTAWSPGGAGQPKPQPPPSRGDRPPQFKPGDRVDHGLFGQGIVLKSEVTADDEEVTVAFAGRGTKTLLVGFAKLRKITG